MKAWSLNNKIGGTRGMNSVVVEWRMRSLVA